MSSSSHTNNGLKKGQWSKEEDELLKAYVTKYGEKNWNTVSKNAGLNRDGKSCRFRWCNHLHPKVKKGSFSKEEEEKVLQLYTKFGGLWSKMAAEFPGRTDNAIKNFWNGRKKRKRERRGLQVDDELNCNVESSLGGSSSQQVDDLQEEEFNIPEKNENNFRYSIGTSGITMAMQSNLPPLPQYPQIPPPMKTQCQMSESISSYKSGSLESMFYTPKNLEGSDVGRVRSSTTNLVDEKGKKPISLENDVEANHDNLMHPADLCCFHLSYHELMNIFFAKCHFQISLLVY
uniref:MYB family transcription factor n=1 Tax=Melilotus albus TaxID=47082 RepID=A0A896W3U3_MELAB|nr:MYB family transcription factor [Melilotus albus]